MSSSTTNNQTMVGENHHHQSLTIDAVTPEATPSTVLKSTRSIRWLLLLLNCTSMAVGSIGVPLLTRLYYLHGGSRKWLQSTSQNIGFLIFSVPLVILYIRSQRRGVSSSRFLIELKLFLFTAVVGLLMGLAGFMTSFCLSYVPVSTSSILSSTQLAFTAGFAWLIVKQKFTSYSVNSVVIMTLGSVTLALHTDGDRPAGVSKGKYLLGFFVMLGTSALLGLLLPLMELVFTKASKTINYVLVLQCMFNIGLFATLFSTIGMLINKDLQAIPREARAYELGKRVYYIVLVSTSIVTQLQFIGLMGILCCTSSLFTGIYSFSLLPLVEIAAVICFHEKFTGEKGISLALFLWSFTFYFYGEYKKNKDKEMKLHAQVPEPYECNPSHITAL